MVWNNSSLLFPFILSRCIVQCMLLFPDVLSQIFLVQRLVRLGLRGKPAAVGLCCQFS